MKVESVERRESACCSARRRREGLTDAWFSVLTADTALCPFLLAGDVQAEVPQESRQPLSFPQVSEKRNGNTVLSPKPTDGTKRSQTEWSETDCTEQASCSGETPNPSLEKIPLRFRPFCAIPGCGVGNSEWRVFPDVRVF